MIVVLTGAPGAGKGTQASKLSERCGHRKVSTGDALRRQVKLGTPIGQKAGALMAKGELVPDDVLFEVLREELGPGKKGEVILLDGYPRKISQAETLETLRESHPVGGAIQLEVPREELIARLSGRRVCEDCGATYHLVNSPPKNGTHCDACNSEKLIQRSDDNPESVAYRLDVYEQNTRPILDFYKKSGCYTEVDGSKGTEEVFQQLEAEIKRIQKA